MKILQKNNVLLETKNLTKSFGGIHAVEDVNLHINRAGINALIGPNGAGKTTLFNCITGFYPPTKGRILFNDEDITGLKP
ncbi:MAG: ATP-binding cassette domain-containing protein, partial [Nitrospirota bacterium]